MRTDPRELHRQQTDFLVVGGGIHGAALARELAVRGAGVILVDRGDFASGTSMRSSRLIHGGVRYLEQLHLKLVYEALHERERLLRLAPHLVRPLPMLMPFFEDAGKSPFLLKLGLRLYSLMAGRSTLPRPRSQPPADCLRSFPGLRERGLRGGMLFHDAKTDDLRLTLAVLRAAAIAGAHLCSHTALTGLRPGEVVELHDHVRDERIEVRPRAILNAAGPWVDGVRRLLGIDGADLVRASRGSHLVLPPMGDLETALAGFLRDGRIHFVIPHDGGVLSGTTDVAEPADGEATVPEADAVYLLDALGELLADPPGRDDVSFAYAGWRSLPAVKGPPGGLNREAFVVDEVAGSLAVHSVVGGKLTTHRAFAERAINKLLRRRDPSPTREAALPGGAGPREPRDPLWWRHGSDCAAVRGLAGGDKSLLRPVFPDRDVLGVEVAWALREQGAVSFTDLMLRRLHHVAGPPLDAESLRRAFDLFTRFRPADLPPVHFAVECDELKRTVRSMAGVFAHAFACS